MTEKKKIEVVFAPGCFDSFEGTQQELDDLVKEIQEKADSGELFNESKQVQIDQLMEELSEDQLMGLLDIMENLGDELTPADIEMLSPKNRTLQ